MVKETTDPLLTEDMRKCVDQVVADFFVDDSSLIEVLHKVQEQLGYLPKAVQKYISHVTKVPLSAIYEVTTFYALFSETQKGKYEINLCLGTACYVKGAQQVLDAFKKQLGIPEGATTEDKRFTLGCSRCIGACGLAPVLSINGEMYGKVTPKDVTTILSKYQEDKEVQQ